jgi:CheY-like chemotaxis protein
MPMAKSVLVVDDDIDIVEQVSFIVTNAGHQVTTAFNRQEAEEILETMTVDMAIVDMMMEDMHAGCLLCRHIKRLHPGTAVIVLTSLADPAGFDIPADPAHVHAMLHCDAFIRKPVLPRQLKSLVDRLLEGSENKARQAQS